MQKRIYFTGASGKAGKHAAAYLIQKGHRVLNADITQVNQAEVNAAAEQKSSVVTNMANAMRSDVTKEMESMQSSMKNENLGSTFQGVADIVGKTFSNLGDKIFDKFYLIKLSYNFHSY